MELQFPHSASSAPSLRQKEQLEPDQISERLAVLNDRHAILTEKLRELHDGTLTQSFAQIEWHDLKKQVLSLRFEMETLICVLQSTKESSDIIILTNLLEF